MENGSVGQVRVTRSLDPTFGLDRKRSDGQEVGLRPRHAPRPARPGADRNRDVLHASITPTVQRASAVVPAAGGAVSPAPRIRRQRIRVESAASVLSVNLQLSRTSNRVIQPARLRIDRRRRRSRRSVPAGPPPRRPDSCTVGIERALNLRPDVVEVQAGFPVSGPRHGRAQIGVERLELAAEEGARIVQAASRPLIRSASVST